jgi:hypothetical protein
MRWYSRGIVEAIGLSGIVSSLVYVGLEVRQQFHCYTGNKQYPGCRCFSRAESGIGFKSRTRTHIKSCQY